MDRRISVRMDMDQKIKHAERTGGISRATSQYLDMVDIQCWDEWNRARRTAKANRLAAQGADLNRTNEE